MASGLSKAPQNPWVEFPDDSRLGEFAMLFDPEWVWRAYCERFGEADSVPSQISLQQLSHSLGRMAIATYTLDWDADEYLPSQNFIARVEPGKTVELFQFPDDPSLPGLKEAADPEGVHKLLSRHVLAVGARRARVEVIRYRPGSRAVLRHSAGRMRFYARVMRPSELPVVMRAWEIVAYSDFVVPRIAGYWADGGVLWLSEIPGKNLRNQIRRGNQPDTKPLLDGLETLWSVPDKTGNRPPFNLSGAYRAAKRSLVHMAAADNSASASLKQAAESLDPFIESWQPSCTAHNDFYDDQILVLPDGRMVLVDFEEAGPGDPLLDVGNFLAHLRWASRFRQRKKADASAAFHEVFRSAALDRFRWSERELNLREAVCLFRLCTTPVRHPHPDWRRRLAEGLSLVNEVLDCPG